MAAELSGPTIVAKELTLPPADIGYYSRILDVLEAHTRRGEPYTGMHFLADTMETEKKPSLDQEDLLSTVGSGASITEDVLNGESVRAVRYNSDGSRLASYISDPSAGKRIGALLVEKSDARTRFRAKFHLLETDQALIEGYCWLEHMRMYKRNRAIHDFADKWGLAAPWDIYLRSPYADRGKGLPFMGILSNGVAVKLLGTLDALQAPES